MHSVSVLSIYLCVGFACADLVLLDIIRGRYQRVPMMNLVWATLAFYLGPIGLAAYFLFGRSPVRLVPVQSEDYSRTDRR